MNEKPDPPRRALRVGKRDTPNKETKHHPTGLSFKLPAMKKFILIIALAMAAQQAWCQSKPATRDTTKTATGNTSTAFRVPFDYVFKRNGDGSLMTMHPVQINGEIIGSGLTFDPNIKYGGVSIGAYQGHDLLIDTIRNVVVIRKVL
jgi:hypothetical protein